MQNNAPILTFYIQVKILWEGHKIWKVEIFYKHFLVFRSHLVLPWFATIFHLWLSILKLRYCEKATKFEKWEILYKKFSFVEITFSFAIIGFDLVNNNQHHSISFVKVLHWIGVYFVCMIYCLHYLVWYPVWGTTSLHYYMILCDVYIIVDRVAQWV